MINKQHVRTASKQPKLTRIEFCKSSTVICDQDHVAKLIDFLQYISLPEGQRHVKDALEGKLQFFAPEYVTTGYVTHKVDVFSFRPIIHELLAGQDHIKSYVEQKMIIEIVDPSIPKEGIELEQLLAFTMLALSCIYEKEEDRPTMIDVAKQHW